MDNFDGLTPRTESDYTKYVKCTLMNLIVLVMKAAPLCLCPQ